MFITIDFGGNFSTLKNALDKIVTLLENVMATQAELVATLKDVNKQLVKVGQETTTLIENVKTLTDLVAAGPPLSQELQDAVAAIATQAKLVDDMVPDPVPVP